MLTIENTYKLIGRSITIKGYPFRIVTFIETPNDYTIGIEDFGTAHAPITVLLWKKANSDGTYTLQRVKGTYSVCHLPIDALKDPNQFLFELQMYLNSF